MKTLNVNATSETESWICHQLCSGFLAYCAIIIIIIFIYLPSDVISQEKTANSSRSITKASKYAIPLKPNTQTCRVKAIFSHLVRRQRRTERSSKSTATSPS